MPEMKKSLLRRFAVEVYLLLPKLLKIGLGRLVYGKRVELGALVYLNCRIDPRSLIQSSATLIKTRMGMYSYVTRGSWVNNATIGNYVSIGPDVIIAPGSHPVKAVSTSPAFYSKSSCFKNIQPLIDVDFKETEGVNIGNDVWIGARVVILDGVVVGNGAIVAAGSVVTKNIEPYAIVAGVPAKLVKYRVAVNFRERIEKLEIFERTPYDLLLDSKEIRLLNEEIAKSDLTSLSSEIIG